MRLVYTASGGFVPETFAFTNPRGATFLAIDGTCHYFASDNYMHGIRTGTLSTADAAALAADLRWHDLATWRWGIDRDQGCPDAGGTYLIRERNAAGRPAVLGSADMPHTLFDAIGAIGARAFVPGRDYSLRVHEAEDGRAGTWDFELGEFELRGLPMPALAGDLQVTNAGTALAALVCAGFTPEFEQVSRALRETRIRGRFQVVPGDIEWVFDVAHNVPAAEGLRANLASLPKRRTLAVCGVLGDKDIAGITAAIAPAVDGWILPGLEGPRAVSVDDLAMHLPAGARVLARESGVAAACKAARALASPGDRILVFGSFLTVGPALEFLGI
jgi:dihydrofolate synthase/folylpolyglutamate synthase